MPSIVAVTVSNPRCGCCGKPGTRSPWYMRYALEGSKSAPLPRRGASIFAFPRGYASLWYTANRNGSGVWNGKLRPDTFFTTEDMAADPGGGAGRAEAAGEAENARREEGPGARRRAARAGKT